jgi:mannosyl-3-phosphoglycerate phosphatase
MNGDMPASLVFSDLDGSLLDHYSYSFEQALPMIKALDRLGIPLILTSSKTCAEIVGLRSALGNSHPFIVENGAAVFIPRHSLPAQPAGTTTYGDYWLYEMAPPRSRWLAALAELAQEYPGEFDSFHSAGVAGIIRMTGLPESEAEAANDRLYSEPVRWLGTAQREARFIESLQEKGATVFRGGRFLSVSANCDKGAALRWLRSQYQAYLPDVEIDDIAIGDSANDLPMLEAAHTALLIRSPVHGFPELIEQEAVIHSQQCGPSGWAEGVSQWLQAKGITV